MGVRRAQHGRMRNARPTVLDLFYTAAPGRLERTLGIVPADIKASHRADDAVPPRPGAA
jgi:hypothetical protein